MTAFIKNLKRERKKKNLTQEQMAFQLTKATGIKVGRASYSLIEKGEVKPHIELLPAMVELFAIDDLYLFLTKC